MTSVRLRVWIEGAIFASLAVALSMLPTSIGSSFSVSLGMIPLTLYSVRRGVKAGLVAGFLWGILHVVTGDVWFLSVSQFLIEYFVAFTFAGFAGFARPGVVKGIQTGNSKAVTLNLIYAILLGCAARYFWHFIAGVIFWGEYALWGMSPFIYSLVMNGASAIATAVATGIVLVLVGYKYPQMFIVTEANGASVNQNN